MYKNNFVLTEAEDGSEYDIATDIQGFQLDSTGNHSTIKVWPWRFPSALFVSSVV